MYQGDALWDVYQWLAADDIRTLCVIVALLFLILSFELYREVRRQAKEIEDGKKGVHALFETCAELRKGKKMTRKERQRYLRTTIPDLIVDAFEEACRKGILTKEEINEHYRILAGHYKMPDLKARKKCNVEELVHPTQAKKPPQSHFDRVKAGIRKRMLNWNFRRLLYTPVKIPGPAVGAEIKARPLRKKGALFGTVRS